MELLTRTVLAAALVWLAGCQAGEVVVLNEDEPAFVGIVESDPGDDDVCLVAEDDFVDFDVVAVGAVEQLFFGVVNHCEQPIIVRGIFVDDETDETQEPAFRVEADQALPFVLAGGDFVDVFAEFQPQDAGEYIAVATVLAGGNEIAEVALVGEAVFPEDGELFP